MSASLVVPIFMGLKQQLNELSVTYNNKMDQTLKLSLDKRLGISISDDNFLLASMVDATIKLRWCKTSEAMEMEKKLLLNAKNYHTSSIQAESCDIDDSPPQKKSRTDSQDSRILSFMTPERKRELVSHLSDDPAKHEVNQYLMEPCIEDNPLVCWGSNENNYPILASMAKRVLAIPASSAPVERLFSIAGKIFHPDRCRLSDNTFHKLIMIKCNSNF